MKSLIILILIASVSSVKIKKCCPLDEIVEKDENSFDCLPIDSESSNSTFYGYNTLVDYDSHWPACGEHGLSYKLLTDPLDVDPNASCVDLMNDKFHIFECNKKAESSDDSVRIMKIKKCCPNGMSYNIFQRQCIWENETSDFSKLLGDKIALFEHEVLKCDFSEALVEYHSLVHGLKIRGNSLIVMNNTTAGPEVIRNSFCIDSALHYEESSLEIPEGMSEEHFHKRFHSKFIAKACRDKSICEKIPCLQKCCPHGERMYNDGNVTSCEPHDSDVALNFHVFNKDQSDLLPPKVEPTEYGLLRHSYCEKYILEEDDGDFYYSGIDGSLLTAKYEKLYTHHEYCVDFFYFKGEGDEEETPEMNTFICFSDDNHEVQFHIYATLLAISAFFLGLTFLVYIFLPKLLNLHGKTVVCHVISLLLGYTFLSAVQFATDVRLPFCLLIAFIVYFGLLSAFSWLNVMCFDIWCTFGSVRTHHGIRRTKEMKRFMYYSLYAWGLPFVLTIFTFMIDFNKVMPEEWAPNIGKTKCWFEKQSSPGHLIFFLIPIGIQISINFVLFVLTAIHCNKIKAEIHRMQSCDQSDQQKRRIFIADKAIFIMNIKLFSVMGISWLLEIMATLYKQNSMWWYISDVFNCLQGVLVFFVFVFKRKVLVAFQKKLGIRKLGLRPKTPTTLSTLDLNSTSVSRHNGRMMTKSSSAATLNTTLILKN